MVLGDFESIVREFDGSWLRQFKRSRVFDGVGDFESIVREFDDSLLRWFVSSSVLENSSLPSI